MGDSLPAANLVWEYLSPKENSWIEVKAEDSTQSPIESRIATEVKFQTFKGEWGGKIVSSHLGIKLTSNLFSYKFRCTAFHFGEIERPSKVLTIDQIGST